MLIWDHSHQALTARNLPLPRGRGSSRMTRRPTRADCALTCRREPSTLTGATIAVGIGGGTVAGAAS